MKKQKPDSQTDIEKAIAQYFSEELQQGEVEISPAVDHQINAVIATRAAAVREQRRHRRQQRAVWAAAAMLLLCLGGAFLLRPSDQQTSAVAAVRQQPTIVDAYLLHRRLQAEQTLSQDDHNEDGTVNRADVQYLAMAAVQVNTGGRP